MAGGTFTGSVSGRGGAESFSIHEEVDDEAHRRSAPMQEKHSSLLSANVSAPLTTSKLENIQSQSNPKLSGPSQGKKKVKSDQSPAGKPREIQLGSMDALLMKLSEQQAVLAKQKAAVSSNAEEDHQPRHSSSESSAVLTPASDTLKKASIPSSINESTRTETTELTRLKKELDAAKNEIARQQQELNQNRIMKHSVDPTINATTDAVYSPKLEHIGNPFDTQQPIAGSSRQNWNAPEEARPGMSNIDSLSTMWGGRGTLNHGFHSDATMGANGGRAWSARNGRNTTMPPIMMAQPNNFSLPISPRVGGRAMNEFSPFGRGGFSHLHQQGNRRGNAFDMYGAMSNSMDNLNIGAMSPNSAYQPLTVYSSTHHPQPIGTPLSPMAAEFQSTSSHNNPWNAGPPASPGQTYVSPMEPLNYRRLLDRNVTCNWKYIVDKIVCNNDQQASIFLQQKLKVGTAEQKYEIIEAIVAQAYPLMVNRFGNFLVQRCFEHGTPEQVIAIANAIRGNTLSLSMDPFGCHVVQKAFDAVPEDYKAIMVHELLRRIPETVIHRYACHVWQKLFELRWSDSPPQIMKYVNEALRGMWHEVALGETGSLVVQNIFENCLEEDKRPCIDEVLQSIDIVAHGQFGNWCIQHICEHGLPADRSRAIDHVLRYATEYSMDQFASKVVEKCLKIGGAEFLERYLERVCEGRADRPRIPLIDIASDQYGNYLIQFILTHASPNHREVVASHIRKHMVSLRGSKFGSRVGMLCCNPAYTTHPGPGVGMGLSNRFSSAPTLPRYGSNFR